MAAFPAKFCVTTRLPLWPGAVSISLASMKTHKSCNLKIVTGEAPSCQTNSVLMNTAGDSARISTSALLTSALAMDSFPRSRNISMPCAGTQNSELSADPECPHTLVVVSFYKFADLPDHALLRSPLKQLCQELRVSGGIILAPEGVNGSICGTREAVQKVLGYMEADARLKGLRKIVSVAGPEEEAIHHGHSAKSPLAAGDDAPFRWGHVRVKLKKEVVPLGIPGVSPAIRVGNYVMPKEWNSLISDPDTMVVDVRNSYEIRIGKFQRAVNPQTSAFRDFPFWVEENLISPYTSSSSQEAESSLHVNNQEKRPQRIAMYCTGGIRCEKATSYLLSKGFEEVYHLKGGILKYLEEVPQSESMWEGECFVFDKRVSVCTGLKQGTYRLCYACKEPVNEADVNSPEWEEGVSCPYCYNSKTEEEKERARARQRQYELWGIIGGPDRGVAPSQKGKEQTTSQLFLSKSV